MGDGDPEAFAALAVAPCSGAVAKAGRTTEPLRTFARALDDLMTSRGAVR